MENHIEALKGMVSKCRVGMMGTYGDDGMHFSPMSHVDIDDLGSFWFFTSSESDAAFNIEHDPLISLTYAHEADNTFLSIQGTARMNTNKVKMKELFNSFVKPWFPKGLDDPAISLLVVRPLEVEYWINNDKKVLTHNKMFSANGGGKQYIK